MKAKYILCFIAMLVCFVDTIYSQTDSTFVRYYYPNSQTSSYWSYIGNSPDTKAANVFEMYNGNLVLQALGIFNYPSPEYVFDPLENQESITNGQYLRIIKDGLGGYLALDRFSFKIAKLDANLLFISNIFLDLTPGEHIQIWDILPASDGFIAMGSIPATGMENYAVCAKYDFNLNVVWHYSNISNFIEYYRLIGTSDGGYLFSWSSNLQHYFKVNAFGDSLWCVESQTASVDQLVESNNKYYGLNYSGDTLNTGKISVYAFGENFSTANPDSVFTSITTYQLFGDDDFSVSRTSNNNIVLLVSSPNGELFKFDSDFNLIWSSDNLTNDRIGAGKTPVIELYNGDLLYCSRTIIQSNYTDKFALVRVNSNGIVTPIEDEYQEHNLKNMLSVYPNPFRNKISIEMKEYKDNNSEIAIYNIKGQLVESVYVTTKSMSWMPKNLKSGIYLIKLIQNKQIIESHKITYIK